MSSTESSGAAPAEATATPSAPDAAFPTFGTTRGSGLARGKRPSTGPAASASAPASDYKPTAIEVVNAPREYVNPFAPVNPEPVDRAEEQVAAAPAPSALGSAKADAPVIEAPATTPAPVQQVAEVASPAADETPAELNILPPAEQKASTAQTWESEGFRPARERAERPRREEQREERAEVPADEPVDLDSIPPQFLYVRPGVTFVPTPRNWGGAPRERRERDGHAPRSSESPRATRTPESAPAKTGGFLGWLKGLFGGSASEPVTTGSPAGEARREGGEHRRHRGGRNRGGSGGGEGGGQRRNRGGRGRSGGGYRGERSEGTRSSGSL